MGVRELKHEALLQEWTGRIGECRASGMTVKAWCETQGISIKTYYYWEKRFVEKAKEQSLLPTSPQTGAMYRINPEALPYGNDNSMGADITIRHGETVITMPAGSDAETIAALVKALNRHV